DHDHGHRQGEHEHAHGGDDHDHDRVHGPHGGPLVKISTGQVELSVFETNVPPRFRLYFLDAQGGPATPPAANAVTLRPFELVRNARGSSLDKRAITLKPPLYCPNRTSSPPS